MVDINTTVSDIASNFEGVDVDLVITNTGTNSNGHSGLTGTVGNSSGFDLTNSTGGLTGIGASAVNSGAGTVTMANSLFAAVQNTGAGTITTGVGLGVLGAQAGGTFTNMAALNLVNNAGTIANNYTFKLAGSSDWLSGENLLVLDDATTKYIPLSLATTGITRDSEDVLLATTTSGKVDIQPASADIFRVTTADTDPGSTGNGVSFNYNLTTTGNNANEMKGMTISSNHLDNFDLTGNPISSLVCETNNVGTGTVNIALGAVGGHANSSTGTITLGASVAAIYSVGAAATTTSQCAFVGLNNAGGGSAGVVYAFAFQSEYLSNGRAFRATDSVTTPNTVYIPYSQADTGITYDSADLVLATTTSGDVTITPADNAVVTAGVFQTAKGGDLASANDMAVPTGNYSDVTGTTQINTMAATSIQAGTVISLQFDATVTVADTTAGTGAQFALAASDDFLATAGDTLTVVYDGTFYRELARTAI